MIKEFIWTIILKNKSDFSFFQFRLFHLSCQLLHGHDQRDRHSEPNLKKNGAQK
jgi:hypothetical protein